jgi:hypothetical protein
MLMNPPAKFLYAAVVAAGALYAQGGPGAQPANARVWVDVQVVERLRDRPIEGLTQADFEVRDGGRPVALSFFAAGRLPLDLVIIEPASDASRIEGIPRIVDDLPPALKDLGPDDRVALVRASPGGELVLGLSGDTGPVRNELLRRDPHRKPRKSDCLYDAVSMAASVLGQAGSGVRRRAIVIVAEDRESGSRQNEAGAAAAALKAGATVNILALPARVEPTSDPRLRPTPPTVLPRGFLPRPTGQNWQSVRPVVNATGGDFLIQAERSAGLPELIRRLQARYLIGFSPLEAQPDKPHNVSVKVKGARGANAEVRAATQYWIIRGRTD